MRRTTIISICLVVLIAVASKGFIDKHQTRDEYSDFVISEATIEDIQEAFNNQLTSRKLVDFYLNRIEALNPTLGAVLEVNPDARDQADKADSERGENQNRSLLHGIPILLKDGIATLDKLNTTAGCWDRRFHVMRTWFQSLGMLVLLYSGKLVSQFGMGFVLPKR